MDQAYVFGQLMSPIEAHNQIVIDKNDEAKFGLNSRNPKEHIYCSCCPAQMYLKNEPPSQAGDYCFAHKPGFANFCPLYDDKVSAFFSTKVPRTKDEVRSVKERGVQLRDEFLKDENIKEVWHFWRYIVGTFDQKWFERPSRNGETVRPWKELTEDRFLDLMWYADQRKIWEVDGATRENIALVCAAHIMFSGEVILKGSPKNACYKTETQKWTVASGKGECLCIEKFNASFEDKKIVFGESKGRKISVGDFQKISKFSSIDCVAVDQKRAVWFTQMPNQPITSPPLSTIEKARAGRGVLDVIEKERAQDKAWREMRGHELMALQSVLSASKVKDGKYLDDLDAQRIPLLNKVKTVMDAHITSHRPSLENGRRPR